MGPIEKGTTYIVLSLIHPINRSCMAAFISSGDIQLPRAPLTPSFGVGMVSDFVLVQISVLDSTLAVSAGLVLANQLKIIKNKKYCTLYVPNLHQLHIEEFYEADKFCTFS